MKKYRLFIFSFICSLVISSGFVKVLAQGYVNPIIPGFHPDPSICRVDSDYYLVTSTFEYFPGVPIFHSRDLINWEKIGHCLNRESQVDLNKVRCSGGIYAPTIRYHDGMFYMITTNVGKGNFIVYTKDPRGDWSEPVWLKQGGIDPSLCWVGDDCYMVSANQGHILLCRINPITGEQYGESREIWNGTGGRFPEAPHIYQKDGWFYLLLAEGGTQYGHMVTIGRSRNIDGPYHSNPSNPILTHINEPTKRHPIQGTGHADIVQAHDGTWWLVCLAFRPLVKRHHLLGRETFLAPVTWEEGAWPVVNRTGTIDLQMDVPTLPKQEKIEVEEFTDFNENKLGLEWNFLRNPVESNYSLQKHKGFLRLYASDVKLDDIDSPTFVAQRQRYINGEALTELQISKSGEDMKAGMTVFMNNLHHYDLSLIVENGKKYIELSARLGLIEHVCKRIEVNSGKVVFKVNSCKEYYTFYYSIDGKNFSELGKMDTTYLSSETTGTFTGVYWGLFAISPKPSLNTWVDFDRFEYRQYLK